MFLFRSSLRYATLPMAVLFGLDIGAVASAEPVSAPAAEASAALKAEGVALGTTQAELAKQCAAKRWRCTGTDGLAVEGLVDGPSFDFAIMKGGDYIGHVYLMNSGRKALAGTITPMSNTKPGYGIPVGFYATRK